MSSTIIKGVRRVHECMSSAIIKGKRMRSGCLETDVGPLHHYR